MRYLHSQVARKGQYFEVRGDTLLVGFDASKATLTYGDKPFLCCDLQTPLQRLRNGVFGIKIRSPNLSNAVLTLHVTNVEPRGEAFRYRGSEQFILADEDVALPTQAGLDIERIALPFAAGSSETRTVSIFRGAACKQTIANCTVVYMADGQSLQRLLLAAWRNGRRLADLVFVGVHNADTGGSNRRIAELLRVSEEPDFELFKAFVFGTVRDRVESGQAPRKRYAGGMSNGGAWALSMLAEQPDLFDGAIVMSPAIWHEPASMEVAGKALIIGAGLLEDGMLRQAQKIAGLCSDKGASVAAIYPPSGHSMNSWVNIWIGALKALEH
ncbi:hypothetical protein C9I28_20220 [Pseudoduganella armeniaca]|uniref:Esterase n=1 Tax=Pseudoduganella armeniaca TaxID=2072590 RepID=A0A2R4CDI4_9BURK|nr:hypothetical protein C9I28_20220 [Pseudoduganella armeniaca]